ncbi:MAG: 4Fe-4S binding protein [Firmicutes bacterium]|nr:4Fe-4S binding protein [Bacillota bacterium]
MNAGNPRDGVAFTGVPSMAELIASPGFTPEHWLRRGPRAVIECVEEIPCNPCEKVCPRGAITVGEPITCLPRIDPTKCTGCGMCIPACPGQAIFVVDMSREDRALVSFPWEYLPEPEAGDRVVACDREGEPVCEASVVRVACPRSHDRTRVVTLAVPPEHASRVRTMMRPAPCRCGEYAGREGGAGRDCGPTGNGDGLSHGDDTLVCRCEEVTMAEIRQALADGATTLGGVRRWTRAGMGLCQGRTCRRLVMQEIERATATPPGGVARETVRPPVMPVTLAVLANETGDSREGEGI